MSGAFNREVIAYADGMGISLYQRFTLHEASLFLRIQQTEVEALIKKHHISFIQVTKTEVQFFGFQLIEYLIAQTQNKKVDKTSDEVATHTPDNKESILRFKDVQKRVRLSRTTIWRKQLKGEFPKSFPLGANSVGWYETEIDRWISEQRGEF